MKTHIFIIVLLVAALGVVGWKLHQTNAVLAEATEKLSEMEARTLDLETQIVGLEKELEVANSKSIEGLLKETNKQLFNGLEGLIDNFKVEIDKARKDIEKSFEEEFKKAPNGQST